MIGAWVDGDVIVDCGPTSTLDTLLEGLGDTRPSALLLTHIHFDHAGAAGSLVRRWPDLPVYVHERGARHLADPERLYSSAKRLYGDDMERLWGEMLPVPEENLRVLTGGETVLGRYEVAYTPGHASHHVCFRARSHRVRRRRGRRADHPGRDRRSRRHRRPTSTWSSGTSRSTSSVAGRPSGWR